jgi:hypothetical protein
MDAVADQFVRIAGQVLARFFVQNGRAALPEAAVTAVAERLRALVGERGLPRPLTVSERGEPGEMSEEEVAPLVAQVLGGEKDPLLATAVKQLVKACFYPEFKTCRDSFREVTAEGKCRRQELERVRGRVSGSHCIDCPYWVTLSPTAHEKYLAEEWRTGAAEFAANRPVFLPEDFRQLRRWLYASARGGMCKGATG